MTLLRIRSVLAKIQTLVRNWSAKPLVAFAFGATVLAASAATAQAPVPELLYFQFDETGTSVTNRASTPPANTATATLQGGLTQGGTISGTFLKAVVGTGAAGNVDFVNTGWATNLPGSWTISFFSSEIAPSSTLYYVMGDDTAGGFRIFTNGVAGPNNWILRGTGITDTYLNGGAVTSTTMNTFVYDSTAGEMRAYLNGVLVNTVAQSGPVISGTGPFKVIGYGSNVGLNAGGKVGDVRIYSRALSPSEITAIYDAAFIEPEPEVIPTLGEWAMILLALMLAAGAVILIQRRQLAA